MKTHQKAALTEHRHEDVAAVETRMVGLVNAMPLTAYQWRLGAGVRSTEEVLLHLAGDNYFMLALNGSAGTGGHRYRWQGPQDSSGVRNAPVDRREQLVAELTKSFAFLKDAMSKTLDATLEAPPKYSLRKTDDPRHVLIAYARSNNVTPPWSK